VRVRGRGRRLGARVDARDHGDARVDALPADDGAHARRRAVRDGLRRLVDDVEAVVALAHSRVLRGAAGERVEGIV